MLPQSVLCAPPRGGRRHKRAVAAYTLDRLNRWVEGERASLWASRPAARPHSEASAEARLDLALALGREGLDRKACSALLSQGLCAETPDNVQALRDLHPPQRQPQWLTTSSCHLHRLWSLTLLSGPCKASRRALLLALLGSERSIFWKLASRVWRRD